MQWVKRWGYEMSAKTVRPGIYRLKGGGFYGRRRFTGPLGKPVPVYVLMDEVKTPAQAEFVLAARVAEEVARSKGEAPTMQLWSDFAVSRLEERIRRGKVESEATVERWKEAVPLFSAAWGHLDARLVTRAHIDRWLNTTVAEWMSKGKTVMRKRRVGDGPRRSRPLIEVPVTTVIAPSTVNGWLRVLRAICHAVKDKFDLPKSAFNGVEFFEEGRIYTQEEPNALPPELVHDFMRIAREKYPQHYAMILLGMVTGLRPSSLRPLRRKGPEADLNWRTGVLLVRRSHSRKQLVMNKTKTKADGVITLPESVLEVLCDHVQALEGPAAESDLLFPSITGGLRTRNVLAKPFAAIAAEMNLPFRFTPRGLRRSFNDLARVANIHDAVTRSISGHQTPEMQLHYSTARGNEQRAALEKTHALIAGGSTDERVG